MLFGEIREEKWVIFCEYYIVFALFFFNDLETEGFILFLLINISSNQMKNRKKAAFLLTFLLTGITAVAQNHPMGSGHETGFNITELFGLLEFPFLLLCIYFAFKTASSMKGGIFGKGMTLLAWGFLVMAVGHLHMQIEHFYGINLFNSVLGNGIGSVVWFFALFITWTLSGLGFYKIYRASKGV